MNTLKLSAVSLFLILLLISCGGDSETKTPDPTTQDNEVASQSPTPSPTANPKPTEPAWPSPTPTLEPTPSPSPSPSPRIETYIEKEPYEVTETYYEEKTLEYEVIDTRVEESSYTSHNVTKLGGKVVFDGDVEHVFPIGYVEVKNLDEHLGTFTVHFTVYTLDKTTAELASFVTTDEEGIKTWGHKHSASKKVEIPAGETVESRFSFRAADITDSYWIWDYSVHPPTIQIEKERVVTKYREVEKTRIVYD